MNGFWRTSIFTSGSGIKAPLAAVTHSVKIAFHKKKLMLPKQRKGPRLHRVKKVPKAATAPGKFRTPPNLPGRRGTFTTNFPTHCELSFKELSSIPTRLALVWRLLGKDCLLLAGDAVTQAPLQPMALQQCSVSVWCWDRRPGPASPSSPRAGGLGDSPTLGGQLGAELTLNTLREGLASVKNSN